MNTLNRILWLFRNPATRTRAILVGFADLAFIAAVVVSILEHKFAVAVLTVSVYATIYFVARYYIVLNNAFVPAEEADQIESYDEESEDEEL